ncbi:hypothetical protein [Brucella anthropi]|uniref:Uncharacterized protein n=1 Tax=Brucella anthropi TaxID=529 RepID=A0A8I0N6U4_BRUAN|nr:hypothetical protein [Brucella anthropi]MBE0561760.1 hypothetical protein [Brucella anthropi]
MPIDLSISRAIDRSLKKAKELKSAKLDLRDLNIRQDCEIDIGEVVNSLVLSMDKVMNAVWNSHVRDKNRKPDIYFPCEALAEKYIARLQRYRLEHLGDVDPELEQIISQIQPFVAGDTCWWKQLKDIAAIRHERYPQIINPRVSRGVRVGAGQNLYVEHMIVSGGVVNFKGLAWDQATGRAQQVRVDLIEEMQAELSDNNQDPFDFVLMASQNVYSTAKRIGVHL